MMRYPTILALFAALAAAVPAQAAVTRAAGHDDGPRAGWLDRYQESRQGPEQTERFAENYKIPADGSLDLNQVSGNVRITVGKTNEIRVEAIKRVRHRDADEAKRILAALRDRSEPDRRPRRNPDRLPAHERPQYLGERRLHDHGAGRQPPCRSRPSPATSR